MKRSVIAVLVVLPLLFAACGKGGSGKASSKAAAVSSAAVVDADRFFTKDELAKFNGKNGQPAYIAFDGVVYDVSGVKAWKSGSHKGYAAGRDITEMLKKAPHGIKVISKLKKVGALKE